MGSLVVGIAKQKLGRGRTALRAKENLIPFGVLIFLTTVLSGCAKGLPSAVNTASSHNASPAGEPLAVPAPAPSPTPLPSVPVAKVTAVNPFSSLANGGTTVTITGSDFRPGAVVNLGGTDCLQTAFINSTSLNCVVPPSASLSVRQVDVTVTNAGTSPATLAKGFYYLGQPGLWLRADAGVTQSGGSVSAWMDFSGSGNNATQSNAGSRPRLVSSSSAFNDMPVVAFSGTSRMSLGNLALLNNVSGASVALVASTSITGQAQGILAYSTNSTQPGANRLVARMYYPSCASLGGTSGSAISIGGRTLDTDIDCQVVQDGTFTANAPFSMVGSVDYLNKALSITVNGSTPVTATGFQDGANTSATNSLLAQLGTDGSGTNFLQGNVAEILVYTTVLTPAQQNVLHNYLSQRYKVP